MGEFRKPFLTAAEVAALYPIAIGTLANMRSRRVGPKFYKLPGGRKVVYKASEVEEWLTREPVLTTDSLPETT